MNDLDALLAGIVAHPHEHIRWLVLADWLQDHGQPERSELVQLHRELLRTAADPDAHPERADWHASLMVLLRAGVNPCVPRRALTLPGGVRLPMAFVPPGSFRMGSPETEAERYDDEAAHAVTLTRGFWVGVSPVTQSQWVAVMGANPSEFNGDDRPVESVSWEDAQAFCGKASALTGVAVRLPSEAEWESACRAGTATPFYWGGSLNGTEANCNGNYPYGTEVTGPYLGKTSPIGSYAAVSPHPWGLVDVIGNVWEWCADWFDDQSYTESPKEDPTGPESGSNRVLRGGGWSYDAPSCRAAFRGRNSPAGRDFYHGFRLAADHH